MTLLIFQAASRSHCEPAEPSSRADAYRSPSHFYDLPVDGTSVKRLPFMQENGQLSWEYGAQLQVSSVSPLSHQGKQEQFSSPPKDNGSIPNTEDVFQIGRKRKVFTVFRCNMECYIYAVPPQRFTIFMFNA